MGNQEEKKSTNHICVGLLAHVDGGKTTFSEQLLYHAGVIRSAGRVDQGNTVMDGDAVERARGITIYADQSCFEYGGDEYYFWTPRGMWTLRRRQSGWQQPWIMLFCW